MELSQRCHRGDFYFVVEQHAGTVPGSEVKIMVFAAEQGEGNLLLARTLYFEEQSAEHIDNFCCEFAHDEHYREICLTGRAHWCRVAQLYEVNGRYLADDPVAAADQGRELFHVLRRDLLEIELLPGYRSELSRVALGEECALEETFELLARIPGVKLESGCQGSATFVLHDRRFLLPACHTPEATLTFKELPPPLLHHLTSGHLGQHHLARFDEKSIRAITPWQNRRFIEQLTIALQGYLRKKAARRAKAHH